MGGGEAEAVGRGYRREGLCGNFGGGGRGRGLASWPGPAVGVVEVCRRSRRLDLLGLTRTMLSDEAASLLAGALNTLPDRD